MDIKDKARYSLSISEGAGTKLTEIQVSRIDCEPISEEEVKDLISEFRSLFPKDIYRVRCQTKPKEDDEILHIYVNLQPKESVLRSGTLGKRVIVPKNEIEERLKKW